MIQKLSQLKITVSAKKHYNSSILPHIWNCLLWCSFTVMLPYHMLMLPV